MQPLRSSCGSRNWHLAFDRLKHLLVASRTIRYGRPQLLLPHRKPPTVPALLGNSCLLRQHFYCLLSSFTSFRKPLFVLNPQRHPLVEFPQPDVKWIVLLFPRVGTGVEIFKKVRPTLLAPEEVRDVSPHVLKELTFLFLVGLFRR